MSFAFCLINLLIYFIGSAFKKKSEQVKIEPLNTES